ncbi:MAG: thrombospondin type 3 repeat-containing protein [Gammaproteobacteria bacterium]|nr:thrombospondin type 3 repeat-containing protein [Gammaproteobacteria bacterium]MBQ0838783.1 thrombospondin type 3 repeat-containing protein [Gammaproteobacteria bacterium]
MDIASRYLFKQGLAARLCLLLAFCFMYTTQANALVAAGEWQSADDLSISQGDRFYDRSLGAYYTYNTVAVSAGGNLSGDLRLVVQTSSHTVLNADGEVDGKPFFMVPGGGAEHVVRINFQRKRAAFAYTTQMQRFVEQADPDDDADSVPNSADTCPNTPAGESVDANGCSESQKDDDNDGVMNTADTCPNTPANETVDADGCGDSQKDDDMDGIANSLDQCPNTPVNEVVDADGCSESQKDDDDDQIVNSEDFCPNDATNTCFNLHITVRGGGTALADVAVVVGIDSAGGATTSSSTNGDGEFVANVGHPGGIGNDGLDDFFPVSATLDGFASGFAKVVLAPGVFVYQVDIDLAPVSDIIGDDEDVAAGVSIEKAGEPVGALTIPEASFPSGVTAITGQITYLDPATDVALAPGGDLLALPEGADPNDAPVALETFGMMEFDLVDQDGNPITDLPGSAEVCMKAGAGLSAGDTIPLWYYDDEKGLWIEEGQGSVVDRDGQLMICGEVSHFSWWNYDQPIETHSCFKYHFIDGDTGDSLREVFDWYAEGVTYNGTSPERLCDRDGDDPATNGADIDSLTVKRTTDTANPEQIRVTTSIGGNSYYLVDNGDGSYSLSANVADAAVFNNPQLNASCLNNSNVSDCLFLDYKEGQAADGVLPLNVSDINLPPVISDFSSSIGFWGNLEIGAITDISALVTDIEGSGVAIAWSAQCYGTGVDNGVLTPAADSGPSGTTFGSQFTAPAGLTQFYAYCEMTITATDAEGNSGTASHRLRIIDPGLTFTLQGTVYGTDGQPLPFHSLDLTNWSCSEEISLPFSTDENGAYRVEIGNIACSDGSGSESYYWGLDSSFVYDNATWGYTSDLSGCLNEELGGGVTGDLLCERDIHFPTVWAPLSGTVFGDMGEFYVESSLGDFPWAYASRAVPLDGSGNGQSTYNLMVPVAQGYLWGWDSSTSTSSFREFGVLSTDGLIADFGLASGSATITVVDDNGAPVANGVVTGWTSDGTTSIDTTLDANGQLELSDVPLGRLWLTVTSANAFYNGYGILNIAGEHIDVDVNSPDSCDIAGTAYDLFGQVAPGVDITAEDYSGSNWFTASTQSDGFGAFALSGAFGGGYSSIYQGLQGGYAGWSSYMTINNCRLDVNGNPPLIRVDVPKRYNSYDFFLD